MNESGLITTYTQLSTSTKMLVCKLINQTIELSLKVARKRREEKGKIPYQINVITSAARGRLKETAHSRILVDLLRHEKIRDSFIHKFLNLSATSKDKIPVPDTNRIDITIKNNDFYLIIENKVNGAEEQPGQIYRYYQIAKSEGYNDSQIYVLYLNAETNKSPSDYSLSEEGKKKNSVETILGDRLICRTYKNDIIKWLKKLKNNELKPETYLESALIQYIDYLETYFETSDKYSVMKKEIELLLINELKLNSFEKESEKIEAINNELDNIRILKERLESLRNNYINTIWEKWEEEYRTKYNMLKIISKNNYLGFNFSWNNVKMECCITIDGGLIWGIKLCDKVADKSVMKYLRLLIEHTDLKLGKGAENIWPVWNYTSYENGLTRLKTITNAIIEQSKIDSNLNLEYK